MKVQVHKTIHPDLAPRLTRFERDFSYPLGRDDRFTIDHGDDYLRFYESLGKAFVAVACDDTQVAGIVAASRRDLRAPGNSAQPTWYVGDLKLGASYRGTGLLRDLCRKAFMHGVLGARAAVAVVMEGAARRPEDYAPRTGIPYFSCLNTLHLWSMPTRLDRDDGSAVTVCPSAGYASYERLTPMIKTLEGGAASLRSAQSPTWITTPDGQCVARLEDTLRAKRLIRPCGSIRRMAHLAYFAASSAASARALLRHAQALAAARGYDEVMVALPESRSRALSDVFTTMNATLATASVYGLWVRGAMPIHINSSEI